MTPNAVAESDITVTSATQSEDQMREHLAPAADAKSATTPTGEKPVGEKPIEAKTDAPVSGKKEAAPVVEDKLAQAEADSDTPDAQVSEAARTLRRSRFDERRKQKQTEIDTLTRTAGDLRREVEDLERRRRDAGSTPPAGEKKADAPAAGQEPTAPQFQFPTWEKYQEAHPDASYESYIDDRADARYSFNEQQRVDRGRRDAAARTAQEQASQFKGFEDTFRTATPDYDAALDAVKFTDAQLASPQFRTLQRQVAKAGQLGPAILYHFAKHPDDATRLLASRTPEELIEDFAVIKHLVKAGPPVAPAADGGAKPAPAAGGTREPAAAPSKPVSDAPAPVTPASGGAAPGRSLHSIAEESDDADAYIEQRGSGHLLKRH